MVTELTDSTDQREQFLFTAEPFLTSRDEVLDHFLVELAAAIQSQAATALARKAFARLRRIQQLVRLRGMIERLAPCLCLTPDQLTSHQRGQHLDFCRHLAMYLLKRTSASFPLVGAALNRDHSSVLHGFNLIQRRVQHEPAFRLYVEQLERQLGNFSQVAKTAASEEAPCAY
jgi:chromosomal replication initiation ATPase DnaA